MHAGKMWPSLDVYIEHVGTAFGTFDVYSVVSDKAEELIISLTLLCATSERWKKWSPCPTPLVMHREWGWISRRFQDTSGVPLLINSFHYVKLKNQKRRRSMRERRRRRDLSSSFPAAHLEEWVLKIGIFTNVENSHQTSNWSHLNECKFFFFF